MTRQVQLTLSILATVALTGCGLIPRKPDPPPPPRLVVCAPEALQACRRIVYPTPAEFTAGQYDRAAGLVIVLPDGPLSADWGGATLIAERTAGRECACRHEAVLECIGAHNGQPRPISERCRKLLESTTGKTGEDRRN